MGFNSGFKGLTAIGLSPGGSTHLHTNNTQNNTNNNRTTQITTNVEECGPCPVSASLTLAFALQLRKKHGKTSVRVRKTSVQLRKTSVRVQYTYYQNTHTLQNPHIHTCTHITKQYKTTTVQTKANTAQGVPKWNSHNIIKCLQYKVTLIYNKFGEWQHKKGVLSTALFTTDSPKLSKRCQRSVSISVTFLTVSSLLARSSITLSSADLLSCFCCSSSFFTWCSLCFSIALCSSDFWFNTFLPL